MLFCRKGVSWVFRSVKIGNICGGRHLTPLATSRDRVARISGRATLSTFTAYPGRARPPGSQGFAGHNLTHRDRHVGRGARIRARSLAWTHNPAEHHRHGPSQRPGSPTRGWFSGRRRALVARPAAGRNKHKKMPPHIRGAAFFRVSGGAVQSTPASLQKLQVLSYHT